MKNEAILQSDLPETSLFKTVKEAVVPVWRKPLLTVIEAAKYFQIGEVRIRRMTQEYKNAPFVVWRDSRVYIRRELFETFLNGLHAI